jgi:hypothetical protein
MVVGSPILNLLIRKCPAGCQSAALFFARISSATPATLWQQEAVFCARRFLSVHLYTQESGLEWFRPVEKFFTFYRLEI